MVRRILMHMGPSVGNYRVMLAGVAENVGFATDEFVLAMKESLHGVLEVMGGDDSYLPFIIPGSGTAAMESVTTFLRRGDRVLVVSNGLFGDRWMRIFERYPVEVDSLKATPGLTVTPEEIASKSGGAKYRMTVMTHVETSTGVRAPVAELIEAARQISELTVVDGVASVGGENVEAVRWGADVVLTASQKAIGAPPGLGLLAVRRNLLAGVKGEGVSGYFLDLHNWQPVMEGMLEGRGGYFATPPISTVLSLREAFRMSGEEGLENRIERHRAVASRIADSVEGMGLGIVASPGLRSNTVTGVMLNGLDMNAFLSGCIGRGVEFASGVHPVLKGKYIRIGHMGWVNQNDAAAAIAAIRGTIEGMN